MTTDLQVKPKEEVQAQEQTRPGRYYVPDVDIREDQDALWLRADMPGVRQDGVEVSLENDVLTLEGAVAPDAYEGLAPLYTEYNVGSYVRRFSLARGRFDPERVEARLRNGVLEVKLPKAENVKPRRIPVATA
jgi:HSP20 family molecular chaperone IbpA